jgi:hypothetical protein
MRMATKVGVLVGVGLVIALVVGMRMSARGPEPMPPPANGPEQPSAPILAVEPTQPQPTFLDAAAPSTSASAPKKAVTSKRKLRSETELLERLRKAQDTDEYQLSYELAREGQRRFPDSSNAPEFAAMAIKSLARQGKVSEARAEAETMVNRYVGTHWAREVERHTGAHPTVNQVPPK